MKINLKDQMGNQFEFVEVPIRVISLVPSQTELLFDLGLETNIVAITKFCVHPLHLRKSKKIVGGTKRVDCEKIRYLKPDLIIVNKEENTLEIVTELRKFCKVWVTNIINIEDNFQMINDFGQIFNCQNEAKKMHDKLAFALADFKKFMLLIPKRKVVYFIWKNPWMVVGSSNYINEMLQLNNFKNYYGSAGRYPEIELAEMQLNYNPELILLSSEPFPFNEKDANEIGQIAANSKILFVDGEFFSWYGSRLLKAFPYFKSLHEKLQ